MSVTFTETVTGPEDLRDKFVEWLREKEARARNSSQTIGLTNRDRQQAINEAWVYGETARFWAQVVIVQVEAEPAGQEPIP